MAELAAGAVKTLLGVIHNEALLQGRVGSDVQFIKEEMESMNSFLLHLARTSPPGGEHDEQVHTWMNQVQVLANDCKNCIDMYLYRGNPEIQRARGGLWGYLWWVPWFMQKMVAQHQAAIQLSELKNRARDVGERRLRYGVEVPGKMLTPGYSSNASGGTITPSSHHAAAGRGDEGDDEEEDQDNQVATSTDHPRRRAILQLSTLEDYFKGKLDNWIRMPWTNEQTPGIAVVVPDTEDAGAVAQEALSVGETHFEHNVKWIVDVSEAASFYSLPLLSYEIPFYILLLLEHAKSQSESGTPPMRPTPPEAQDKKWMMYYKIRGDIRKMQHHDKIEKIEKMICEEMKPDQLHLEGQSSIEPLGVLLQALHLLTAPQAEQDQLKEQAMRTLQTYDIEETAYKLQEYMEKHEEQDKTEGEGTREAQPPAPICLHYTQYKHILCEMFPANSQQLLAKRHEGSAKQAPVSSSDSNASTLNTSDEKQTKELVHKYTREVIHDLLEDTLKKLATSKPTQDQASDVFEETKRKIQEIRWEIEDQLMTKGIVDEINAQLAGGGTLIIIKDENNYLPDWKTIIKALSLLKDACGAVVVTTTKNTERAKEYCSQHWEPINYSLAGLYHECVLALTNQPNNSLIFRSILNKCEPHEFCMKIFTHALYANPKRSTEDLQKLEANLVQEKKLETNGKKVLKFSYSSLPKEYKSCLLYLAIFPRGHTIRRSTLVGRWVAEGLIMKEDWPSSVQRAERCFDSLIHRWLVHPVDIGAAGKVKSCMVGGQVHEFITKIAKKQHIVEGRLSHHLARHFSIFSNLQLRGSDTINDFLRKLSGTSQLSLLKVLDLEGCQCFQRKPSYLKDICTKILLLKYLSLRGTDILRLPFEINKLHELEVLDIRQTKVPVPATEHVLLLKLRRLLSGGKELNPTKHDTKKITSSVHSPCHSGIKIISPAQNPSNKDTNIASSDTRPQSNHAKSTSSFQIDSHTNTETTSSAQSLGSNDTKTTLSVLIPNRTNTKTTSSFQNSRSNNSKKTPSVQIPRRIEKMVNLEVLSNVQASKSGKELLDIGKLWQLRKLGVVIEDKDVHLINLFRAVSDLHECLQSLSITIHKPKDKSTSIKLPEPTGESRSINLHQPTDMGCSSNTDSPKQIISQLKNKPKILESLSIHGSTQRVQITPLLAKDNDTLAKITLSETSLNQNTLDILSVLPMLRCIRFLDRAYTDTSLTIKGGKFEKLKYFIVEGSNMDTITFEVKSAPELEKMVFSTTNISHIFGVEELAKLEEIELNYSNKLLSSFCSAQNIAKVTIRDDQLNKSVIHLLTKISNIRYLVLLGKSDNETELTFNTGDFPDLNIFTVDCPGITKISFSVGSALKLKKIVCSVSKMKSLSGIENLPKLKELEINCELVPSEVKEAIEKQQHTFDFIHNKPEKQNQAVRNAPEEGRVGRFPCLRTPTH